MILRTATENDKGDFRIKIGTLLRQVGAMYKVTSDEIIIKIPKFVPYKND